MHKTLHSVSSIGGELVRIMAIHEWSESKSEVQKSLSSLDRSDSTELLTSVTNPADELSVKSPLSKDRLSRGVVSLEYWKYTEAAPCCASLSACFSSCGIEKETPYLLQPWCHRPRCWIASGRDLDLLIHCSGELTLPLLSHIFGSSASLLA